MMVGAAIGLACAECYATVAQRSFAPCVLVFGAPLGCVPGPSCERSGAPGLGLATRLAHTARTGDGELTSTRATQPKQGYFPRTQS